MKPRTEEFLNFLLWSADVLARPTFRNLTDSYESWAYRNGFLRQLATLEHREILERDQKAPDERLYRLTERGRLYALGGRDPERQWSRRWDGRWRLVLFDVPVRHNARRERLRRHLRRRAFGCLQGSVWVTPDPVDAGRETLAGGRVDVQSLLMLEARPCSGETDTEIVSAAWDFDRINFNYARYLKLLTERPTGPLRDGAAAKALQLWAIEERAQWSDAMTLDPLLPERLLPPGYLGRRAWQRRIETLRDAGRQLRTFRWRRN
jgi:phenylacetic acid degradation operon negative regulatory protein